MKCPKLSKAEADPGKAPPLPLGACQDLSETVSITEPTLNPPPVLRPPSTSSTIITMLQRVFAALFVAFTALLFIAQPVAAAQGPKITNKVGIALD